ncbi:MAG: SCE4755 family polysaccharide monooxygenase-like protein, partial [Polyangiales bacterium]
MRFSCLALVVGFATLSPAEARAHLGLDVPASRYGPDTLKTGPCGVASGERTANVTYYEPGETIEVRWDEYVDHPGHYRIAFDDDGDDDFVDPTTMMEVDSNDTVLLDGITDKGQGERDYVATVTLPELSCDNCTLQVIQVMYDKLPYTTPGNDIYYQCADLVLR